MAVLFMQFPDALYVTLPEINLSASVAFLFCLRIKLDFKNKIKLIQEAYITQWENFLQNPKTAERKLQYSEFRHGTKQYM